MYEDDVTLFYSAHQCSVLTEALGTDLEAVCDRVSDNRMSLKVSKCKSMLTVNSNEITDIPVLCVKDCKVEQVDQITLLGDTLTQEMFSGEAPKKRRKKC